MAKTTTRPLAIYSRDLKYMLHPRYAAAPPRRRAPLLAMAMSAALAVALVAWSGWHWPQPPKQAAPRQAVASSYPGPVVGTERKTAPPEAKYTQTGQTFSKTALKSPAQWQPHSTGPHPPKMMIPQPNLDWQAYTVRRGDTLGGIFKRFSIDIVTANRIAAHESGEALKKLLPGRKLRLGLDENGELRKMRYELSRMEELLLGLGAGEAVRASKREIPTQKRERFAEQTIRASLFLAASRAGLSDRLTMELVKIFGWDIDFALDIRSGDHFSVLYEEMFRNGQSIGTGDIIAAEFINDGKVYHAVRHMDGKGGKEYFDLQGNNLRGTFLKTPMQVSRVTSGFSKSRYHPVLKKWRAHRGVDYGAPQGTPVLATGDGRVHAIGRDGGYGNVLVLKHGGQYSTLYAHLSGYKKGLERGSVVKQGEVIGYVGTTGLATGPHLHYEFRVNGEHRDPMNFDPPKAAPIAERHRETFLARARQHMERISDLRPKQVASR